MHKKHHKGHHAMHKDSENEGKAVGHGQFANMPQEVKFKAYPKAHEAGPGNLDDTITGIDKSNAKSESKSKRFISNQH